LVHFAYISGILSFVLLYLISTYELHKLLIKNHTSAKSKSSSFI